MAADMAMVLLVDKLPPPVMGAVVEIVLEVYTPLVTVAAFPEQLLDVKAFPVQEPEEPLTLPTIALEKVLAPAKV